PVDRVHLLLSPAEGVQQTRLQGEELPEAVDVPHGTVLRHPRLPSKLSFAKSQRDRCPASISTRSERSRVQMSCANRHLGWKPHPLGGLTRAGGDPGIARSFFLGPFARG